MKTALPLLLPKAISWAEDQADSGASIGRPLSELELALAREVGVEQPERIRIVQVEMLPIPEDPILHVAALQTGLLGPGMVGLTLGYSVFVCRGYETVRLLSHEFRHVHQYEQAGSIAAFLPSYLRQIIDVGYAAAPLEADARAYERPESRTA